MRWIIRLVVISQVTSHASIGCVVIVSVMTCGTLVGDCGVCSIEWIIIIMYREQGRIPIRIRGVAGNTIRGQTKSDVIWIC